jgi:hypothetical protein
VWERKVKIANPAMGQVSIHLFSRRKENEAKDS